MQIVNAIINPYNMQIFKLFYIQRISKDINNIYTLVTSKRGMIKETYQKEGWRGFEILEAEIPGCEIFKLIIDVKSLTEGMGSFEHKFEEMKTVQNKQLSDNLINEFSSKQKEG